LQLRFILGNKLLFISSRGLSPWSYKILHQRQSLRGFNSQRGASWTFIFSPLIWQNT